jgi:hypothetical protein
MQQSPSIATRPPVVDSDPEQRTVLYVRVTDLMPISTWRIGAKRTDTGASS